MKRRQAVILAGGLGTRLRASTGDLPKPMVPVRGQPFLRRQLELLRDRGMTQALLLTGHRAEVIHDHFERQPIEGIELAYSREPMPLGTGGALREAAAQLEPRFVLVNGDTYLDARYAELLEQADRDGATAMMVVYQDAEGSLDQPGNVDIDADGVVVAYQKSASGRGLPYLDAGVTVWSREAFDRLAPRTGAFSIEHDVFPALIARRELRSAISPVRFYDIGTPERLAIFEREISG
jgi:NDP-sugar pyrophosphorylase family protein